MIENKKFSTQFIKIICFVLILVFSVSVGMARAAEREKPLNFAEKAALKASDWTAIYNLMSLHSWYHAALKNDVELEKYWVKTTPDPIFAQNYKQWVGMETIKKYYGIPSSDQQRIGTIMMHTVSTPVIEIAEDRKTARGVFYTVGAVGGFDKDGKSNVRWMWERYGMECALENGEWKIWHLHVYSDFATTIGKELDATPSGMPGGLTDKHDSAPQPGAQNVNAKNAERFGQESQNNANLPQAMALANGQSDGYLELSPTTPALLMPRPPEPYRTYSETWHYVDTDERAKSTAYTQSHKP